MSKAAKLDALNDALVHAAAYIFQLNFGVSAHVKLSDVDGSRLYWEKIEGKWQLFVTGGSGNRPLAACTVDQKKLAAHKLDELLVALRDASAVEFGELDSAIAAAREFVGVKL